jgi:putative Mg2+ transporter-C (MgtC) family protein
MDLVVSELTQGLPDSVQAVRIVLRTLAAALLGGIIGYERARTGKAAGVRTHMLVALGAALFVMAALEGGIEPGNLAGVVQGIAAGVGFLGAGTILKLSDEREIRGLTTAAGIWMTAAMGIAVGLGRYGLAAIAVFVAWLILTFLPSSGPSDDQDQSA